MGFVNGLSLHPCIQHASLGLLPSVRLKIAKAAAKVTTLKIFTILLMSYSKHCTVLEKEKVFIMWRQRWLQLLVRVQH